LPPARRPFRSNCGRRAQTLSASSRLELPGKNHPIANCVRRALLEFSPFSVPERVAIPLLPELKGLDHEVGQSAGTRAHQPTYTKNPRQGSYGLSSHRIERLGGSLELKSARMCQITIVPAWYQGHDGSMPQSALLVIWRSGGCCYRLRAWAQVSRADTRPSSARVPEFLSERSPILLFFLAKRIAREASTDTLLQGFQGF